MSYHVPYYKQPSTLGVDQGLSIRLARMRLQAWRDQAAVEYVANKCRYQLEELRRRAISSGTSGS
jgi:hypothetical protein